MPHKLSLKLKDPVTVGFGATPGNELRSLTHIPATTLRGAIFDALRSEGLETHAESLAAGPRWTAAWPQDCIPMPLCFSAGKGEGGFQTKLGVWNNLSLQPNAPTHTPIPKRPRFPSANFP